MSLILELSSGQKRVYDLLYKEMSRGNYSINLPSSFPEKNVNLIVKLVLGEHPELINFDNCSVILKNFNTFKLLKLKPVFTPQNLKTAQHQFNEETNNIIRSIIKPKTNLIQKVLAIHDFIVNNIVYDDDAIYKATSSVVSHTAYGAIVQKKAVCEGIAYAFSYLANQVGINTTVVNGIADGEAHTWNMIEIGSDYYHIDATWDIQQRKNTSIKIYDYFCLSDLDLNSRRWDKKIYPKCISSKFNYFNVTDSFAHNRQQLREILLRQYSSKKSLYFKYDFLSMNKEETIDFIWNELLDVAKHNGLELRNATILLNEDQNIFTLYSK